MKVKGRGRRKRRVKFGELAGFIALGLFIVFVAYLLFPSPPPASTPQASKASTLTTERRPLKAAVVDQLSVHSPNPAFLREAEALMRGAGFDVDVYPPERVTVSLYASLPAQGYRLIVYRVHAGVSEELKGRPVGLFTTEPYSTLAYPQEQLTELVGAARPFNRSETVFAVTPRFVRERSIMDYGGAVIVLTGCFGLYSRELPQAFIDRGASVVIGWTGLVGVEHTDRATLALLKAMLSGKMSVGDSVRTVMGEVGPDPESHSLLGYYPPERRDVSVNVSKPSVGLLRAGLPIQTSPPWRGLRHLSKERLLK